MNFFNVGATELLLILVVVLVVFGPNKLPEIGASLGNSLRKFRQASKELTDELDLEDLNPSTLNPSTLLDVLEAQADDDGEEGEETHVPGDDGEKDGETAAPAAGQAGDEALPNGAADSKATAPEEDDDKGDETSDDSEHDAVLAAEPAPAYVSGEQDLSTDHESPENES